MASGTRLDLWVKTTRGLQSLGQYVSGSRRIGSLRVVVPFLNVKSRSGRIPIRTAWDRPKIEKQVALALATATFDANLAQVPIRGYGAFASRFKPPPAFTALLVHDGVDLVERHDGDRALGIPSWEHRDRSTRVYTPAEDCKRGDCGRQAQERFHQRVAAGAKGRAAIRSRPRGRIARLAWADR